MTDSACIRSRDLSYSVRRHFVDDFHFHHVPGLPSGGLVLDLGGNRLGKRGMFNIESYGLQVVYTNLSASKKPHAQADAEFLPFQDERFEAVVCSELLEHVSDPPCVLREIFRVLRKSGTALICVPFMNRIHGDPHDYGRYTDYYWTEHLGKIGFDDIRIERQGGFWSVLVEMLRYVLYLRTSLWGLQRAWMLRIIAAVAYSSKLKAMEWDQLNDSKANPPTGFTTGFGISARKP